MHSCSVSFGVAHIPCGFGSWGNDEFQAVVVVQSMRLVGCKGVWGMVG